ncbi:hypothetical protein KP509_26G053900 [Ceratopteris richardii]|uniref:Uncharacterized protein n=1 Tax=Ceratopteris richardii TaxID=49495 RepID=A0A8T2RL09_CERRI|nr:hypothetical protein KP509_26G053900 [Ceratopteris richardii]
MAGTALSEERNMHRDCRGRRQRCIRTGQSAGERERERAAISVASTWVRTDWRSAELGQALRTRIWSYAKRRNKRKEKKRNTKGEKRENKEKRKNEKERKKNKRKRRRNEKKQRGTKRKSEIGGRRDKKEWKADRSDIKAKSKDMETKDS